jgi:hypothetical protein
MNEIPGLPALLDGVNLRRATVRRASTDAVAFVLCDEPDGSSEVECEVLQTAAEPVRLAVGDTVLVWRPGADQRGVILGRIGTANLDHGGNRETPDELVIEARHSLTLRVGQGSITIREDGKILIKGQDLVSHAIRTNRIRGGSVSIN